MSRITLFPEKSWRQDFPLLMERQVKDQPLVYLDNAATTQKPKVVIDAIQQYYRHYNANIHRGVHTLSEEATTAFEDVRHQVQHFIGATSVKEIIFTRGTTEAINLLAFSFGTAFLKPGDEILLSGMEHHSNIIPWQMAATRTGATIRVIPLLPNGTLDLTAYENLLSERTKMVGLIHASNALGTINPIKGMISQAHAVGAKVLIDAAQSIAHFPIDVNDLDCDFLCFSGHKIYAPTGVGVLYGKQDLLHQLPPYQGGGDMIRTVSFEHSTFQDLPAKFEAGTPPIAEVIGLGEALTYLNTHDFKAMMHYENQLMQYALEAFRQSVDIRLIGEANDRVPVISFLLDKVHPHDLGTILDQQGIAIRTGHHCAMPVMTYFKVPATARLSLSFYNTIEDIDRLIEGLHLARKLFQ